MQRAGISPAVQKQEIHSFEGVKKRDFEEAAKPSSILKEIDVFKSFSDADITYLCEQMYCHHFSVGENIVQQGDIGKSLFVIVEGVVGIYVYLDNGKSVEVARLGAGNFFGEIALLKDEERTASVISITETFLYEINKSDIAPLMEKQPKVSQRISTVLNYRQVNTEFQMKSLQYESPVEREILYKRLFKGVLNFFDLGSGN